MEPQQHLHFSRSDDKTDQGHCCYNRDTRDLDKGRLGQKTHHWPGHGRFVGATGTERANGNTALAPGDRCHNLGGGGWEKAHFSPGAPTGAAGLGTGSVCVHTRPALREEDALRSLLESARSSFLGEQQSLQGNLARSANQGQGPVCGGGQGHLCCDTQVLLGQGPDDAQSTA